MKAPMSMRWPFNVQPRPFPEGPPPANELMTGVMTLSENALMSVLNARATTRPTAITINSPCIKKFLKPFIDSPSSCPSEFGVESRHDSYQTRSPGFEDRRLAGETLILIIDH